MKKISVCFLILFLTSHLYAQQNSWNAEKANQWYVKQGWLTGCNFLPGTAVNQLEMWQEETFDPITLDRELGWAENIGFKVVRVYLHDIAWKTDSDGFKKRINSFLAIASKHNIKAILVFFDDCWNPDPKPGKQPEPKAGVHNSGWVQSPSKEIKLDSTKWGELEKYVKDVLNTFKDDSRILMWDLYNEPSNSGYGDSTIPLVKKIFQWAWDVRPLQPLTVAAWSDKFDCHNCSDVITFHNYDDAQSLEKEIVELLKKGRPVICSEYMARTNNSRFETHLPIFKKYNVGAINWGFVSGKSNTIFPWGSKEGSPEPKVWFHDIFRKDGIPYDAKEIEIIKSLNGKK
jgi:hypothetical protein